MGFIVRVNRRILFFCRIFNNWRSFSRNICWSVIDCVLMMMFQILLLGCVDEIDFHLVHSFQNYFILFHKKFNFFVKVLINGIIWLFRKYPWSLFFIVHVNIGSNILLAFLWITWSLWLCFYTGLLLTCLRWLEVFFGKWISF